MPSTITFHHKKIGETLSREDWWRLIVNDDGTRLVEHEWSHRNPYSAVQPELGRERYEVEEFLAGAFDNTAKVELAKLLEGRDR